MTDMTGEGKSMNKPIIISLARAVAEVDPKYKPYDDLPYYEKLSCHAKAQYILDVIKRWKEMRNG